MGFLNHRIDNRILVICILIRAIEFDLLLTPKTWASRARNGARNHHRSIILDASTHFMQYTHNNSPPFTASLSRPLLPHPPFPHTPLLLQPPSPLFRLLDFASCSRPPLPWPHASPLLRQICRSRPRWSRVQMRLNFRTFPTRMG